MTTRLSMFCFMACSLRLPREASLEARIAFKVLVVAVIELGMTVGIGDIGGARRRGGPGIRYRQIPTGVLGLMDPGPEVADCPVGGGAFERGLRRTDQFCHMADLAVIRVLEVILNGAFH